MANLIIYKIIFKIKITSKKLILKKTDMFRITIIFLLITLYYSSYSEKILYKTVDKFFFAKFHI